MIRLHTLLPLMLALSAVTAAVSNMLAGAYTAALMCVVTAAAWWGYFRRSELAANAGFAALVALSALALMWGAPPVLATLSVTATLGAWDLSRLQRRLSINVRIERGDDIERQHVRRLLMVLGAGLALAVLAQIVRVGLSFPAVAVLTFVMVFVLGNVIHRWHDER